MGLQIGIVGLPNAGKSTLFNALIKAKKALTAPYPFCTIDPNVGVSEVPDERLAKLKDLIKPEKTVPATIEFIDIAGLVKNASKGEGLGNQFLAKIRECDAICHLIRIFKDANVPHTTQEINPKEDITTIHTELILKDLESVLKKISEIKKKAEMGDKELKAKLDVLIKVRECLDKGSFANILKLDEKTELPEIQDLFLLTIKPFIFAANIAENEIKGFNSAEEKKKLGLKDENELIPISAKIEEELIDLPREEAILYLESLGLKETGLNRLIFSAYKTLDLITFYTIKGGKELHAWTLQKGLTAPKAAGKVHSDFEKGFIKAEVISCNELIKIGKWTTAHEKGLLRIEGKEYVVQDSDVVEFKFNV